MEQAKRPETMERITTSELAKAFIEEQVAELRKQIGDKKVLLALSGGVDSSVVAALLIKAVGQQLVCVHVNHGLLRKGEPEQVIKVFRDEMKANLIYVDATERFLGRRQRSGNQTQDHRRRIHRSICGRSKKAGRHRVPGPGYHLSGYSGKRTGNQGPSQCGRPASRTEL